ncbi:MAG: flagellar filament capping protein FliD [Lachnospiraceae bacterium]|nr:flagellar filament capping protein FliD [Lachnospiraceae bacterium]
MPVRLSGMNSGLDTEAIVAELVKAKSTKKENLEKDQKKLSWKQDAWKDLNSKIYGLYSKTLSDMRFSSSYAKKKTTSSSSAVSVVTGTGAPETVQSLKMVSMAKAGYHTGAELKIKLEGIDEPVKADWKNSTKLVDMGLELGEGGSKTITIKNGANATENPVSIEINENTTIKDVVDAMNAAGVKANFDEKNQRFYISASGMGKASDFTLDGDNDVLHTLGIGKLDNGEFEGKRIEAADAEIELNGETYTSTGNTFEINGLTITLNNMTSDEITLTTSQDTSGVFDTIKNFLKEYNTLINEMDKLYNAESAAKYKMLSDDEKEEMNEDDVKEWDDKIKSALLRKDSTLGNVSNAMKTIMLAGVEMSDGSKMHLSDFGINTLGYFAAADNEKSAYHIDGDKDDESTSGKEDKLSAMIASDPDKVSEFFSSLAKSLYTRLDELMSRTDYSSAFTVYNDKAMKTEYDDYKTKISKQEEKINTWEDFYYKKFTRMEKAMAKLQSQESALGGLFGGN